MTGPAALAGALARLKTWLVQDAFPLWSTAGADRLGGGYHDLLDLKGRPVPGPKRARVQARQAFVFAAAPALGWDGPWEAAMRHGLDYLEQRHRRPDGLYRASVVLPVDRPDDSVDVYDQAFVLFALAAAHRAGEADAQARAEALLGKLHPHPLAGFRELSGEALKANQNMHLFEAFMAWTQVGGGTVWRALADRQAELALTRLIGPETGALSEFFGPGWTPPEDPADRLVEPGHLFEWAWLLLRWSVVAGRAQDLRAALRLIETAERSGVHHVRGVAVNGLDGALAPADLGARLWPQTERLKASLLAAQITGDDGCWAAAENAAATVLRYLETPTPGLWRDRMDASGAFVDEPSPASSLYHIVLAIQELERVVGAA